MTFIGGSFLGAAGGGGGGSSAMALLDFMIYRPGGTTGGRVFATWAELMTALGLSDGPVAIIVDDSIVTPAPIPAGGPYDMKNSGIFGIRVDSGPVDLVIEDGASLSNIGALRRNLRVINETMAPNPPPITLTSDRGLYVDEGSYLRSDGDVAMILKPAGATNTNLVLNEFSRFENSTAPVLLAEGPEAAVVVLLDISMVFDDTIEGAVGTTFFVIRDANSIFNATQTGIAGTLTVNLVDLGSNVFFDPSVIGQLSAGTVQAAIDELTGLFVSSESKVWKELVLDAAQLVDGATGGVVPALLVAFANAPIDGDTFILDDGTVAETFTFRDTPGGAFDVQTDVSAAVSLANLVAAIVADSAVYGAQDTSGLDNYFSPAQTAQAVIYTLASSITAHRAYGVWATQADCRVVEFATGVQNYQGSSGTESALPAADPGIKTFGFGRDVASLVTNETHSVAENQNSYTWDSDDQAWNQTGGGASSQLPTITLAGATPDAADFAALVSDGQWALAKGTGGRVFMGAAVNTGTLKKFAVELSELT